MASLAKQLEEVFVPGRPTPVEIPRDSEAIYLLQQASGRGAQVRHRVPPRAARTEDDQRRARRHRRPRPGRRRRLLSKSLGGVRAVQAASLDDLLALSWLPQAVGHATLEHLHARRGSKAG